MAQTPPTFLDEAVLAAQGCWALVTGQRQASGYFDFSQRGLLGSLIAVVLGIALAGYGPALLGFGARPGAVTQSVVVNAALFLAQAGTAYLALRQMKRQDGYIPYLVASNWVTLVSAVLLIVATLAGPAGIVVMLAIAVVAVLTFINIGRYIVTLTPIQIGLLFLSQAVGVFLALGIVAVLFAPVVAAG